MLPMGSQLGMCCMCAQDTAMLEYERRVSALRSAARMQRTRQRKEEVLEERRAAILAAEEAAEFRMQQKEEVRGCDKERS